MIKNTEHDGIFRKNIEKPLINFNCSEGCFFFEKGLKLSAR